MYFLVIPFILIVLYIVYNIYMSHKWTRVLNIVERKIEINLRKHCRKTNDMNHELVDILFDSKKTNINLNLTLKEYFCIELQHIHLPKYYKLNIVRSHIFRLNNNLLCPKLYNLYLDLEQYFGTTKKFSIKTEVVFSKLFGDTIYSENELIELISELTIKEYVEKFSQLTKIE